MEYFTSNNGFSLGKELPKRNISIMDKDGKVIGSFYVKDDKLEFEGNATESAKIFVNEIKRIWGIIK